MGTERLHHSQGLRQDLNLAIHRKKICILNHHVTLFWPLDFYVISLKILCVCVCVLVSVCGIQVRRIIAKFPKTGGKTAADISAKKPT